MLGMGLGLGLTQHGVAGGGASLIPVGAKVYIVGDSMTYAELDSFPSGYITWLIAEADGRFNYPSTLNPGTGDGSTTSGGNMAIKGQAPSLYAARKAVIAAAVGTGVLIIGGIENDYTGAWTHVQAVIDECTSASKIFITPAAPTKSSFNDPTGYAAFNSAASAYATASGGRIVYLDQTWTGIELATSGTTGGAHAFDVPGVHQNPLGAKLQAVNMWAQMAPYFASGTAYDWLPVGSNIMSTYTPLTGTGGTNAAGATTNTGAGGETGGVASNMTIVNGAGTLGATLFLNACKDSIAGYDSQVIEFTGTAAATGLCSIRRNSISHTFATNDIFAGASYLKVSNVAQNGPPVGLRSLGGPGTYFANCRWGASAYSSTTQGALSPAAQIDAIVVSHIVNATSVTAGGSTLNFDWYFSLLAGAVDVRIEIARPMLFNLTQAGLA